MEERQERDDGGDDVILCHTCGNFYPAIFELEHVASEQHNQFFRNYFIRTESAAKCRLITLSADNPNGILGVEEYLELLRENVVYWLNQYQIIHKSLKYNMLLECKFYKDEERHQLRAFKTQNAVVYQLTDTNEQYSRDVQKILNEKHDLEQRGSGWSLFSVDRLELRINRYEPMTGGKSSRFELPPFIKKRKCIVNPYCYNSAEKKFKCCENQCFKFSILGKPLLDAGINVNNIRNYYRYVYINNRYNWGCIDFPVTIESVGVFEKHNGMSINIYGVSMNNVYPLKVTRNRKADHRDILYYNQHYCWIKNFDRLVSTQVYKSKKVRLFVCRQCFKRFYKQNLLLEHEILCSTEELYKNGGGHGLKPFQTLKGADEKIIYFKNYHRQLQIPYVIYADIKLKFNKENTCIQNPELSYVQSLGHYEPEKFLYCVAFNGEFQQVKEFANIASFMKAIEIECKKIGESYKVNIPLVNTPLYCKPGFSDPCHICEKPLENDYVLDHDHTNGFLRGFAHSHCNVNFRLPNFVPVIMNNFSKYNSSFILQYFFKTYDEKKIINIIPCNENTNKCMALSYRIFGGMRVKFIDQCRFVELPATDDFLSNVKRFERVRKICHSNYKIDLAHYISIGAFSWDAMLKLTKVQLELITDQDMYRMVSRGIRGGLVQVVKRYAYAASSENSKPTLCKEELTESHIFYFDIINLYGKIMLDYPLPHSDFSWVQDLEQLNPSPYDDDDVVVNAGIGFIFEVDLEYPETLRSEHADYPLCPNEEIGRGLVASFREKKNYVIHHTALRQALKMGIVLKKIHRAIKFKESLWLSPYIRLNTMLRTTYFGEKHLSDVFKLQSNVIYGKSIEKLSNQMNVYVLKSNAAKLMKLIKQPNFSDRKIINENTYIVFSYKWKCKISKPIAVGMSILDLSKRYMYNLYYNKLKPRLPPFKLLYTDNDAIMIQIYCKKTVLNSYFKNCQDVIYWQGSGKKQIGPVGMFKDQCPDNPIVEYVGLRCKVYGYRCRNTNTPIVRNLPKWVDFNRYIQLLVSETKTKTVNYYKRLVGDKTYELCVSKNLPTINEDRKRTVCSDRIHTQALDE